MTNNSPETETIRQRMEEVRRDLDEGVQEIVESAHDLGEWRSYVRTYPWASLGVALAVGYLVVPRPPWTRPDARTLAELADQSRLLAMANVTPKGRVRGMLLAFVGKLVLRGVSNYVGHQADRLFATRATRSPRGDQS